MKDNIFVLSTMYVEPDHIDVDYDIAFKTMSRETKGRKTRSIGWVYNRDMLTDLLSANAYDLSEDGYYNLAVVEEVSEGIYPYPKNEWWYIFDKLEKTWIPIDKPEYFRNVSMFGIGN